MNEEHNKKFLLIESDEILAEIVALGMKKTFGIVLWHEPDVLKASVQMEQEQMEPMESVPLPAGIVADESCIEGLGKKQLEKFETYAANHPFVLLIHSHQRDWKKFKTIQKPDVLNGLKKTWIQDWGLKPLHESDSSSDDNNTCEYYAVNIKTFLAFNRLSCDVYVKLSDGKYVKLYNKGDYFGEDDFEKYRQKKIDQLYIQAEYVDVFLEKIVSDLKSLQDLYRQSSPEALSEATILSSRLETRKAFKQVSDALASASEGKLNPKEGLLVCQETIDTLARSISKLGINRDIQQLTKASVTLAIKSIRGFSSLNLLLAKLEVDPQSYLSSHSTLLAHLSCSIAHTMGWASDMTFYKLTLAAFIHDITLENSKLAKIKNLSELIMNASDFTEEEVEAYVNHTENAAKIISELREIPPDVGLIVSQHHERPDGTGFPRDMNFKNISQLVCAFIVAHDLVDYIVAHQQENWNLVSFLNRYRSQYQNGGFKTVFDAMWERLVHSTHHNKAA